MAQTQRPVWSVRVLGMLSARLGDGKVVERFRTRKAASLFAYLATHLNRSHSREELAEMIWPDVEPESSRNSLKQEIAALRRQLEPAGFVEPGSVIIADRTHVRLNQETVECDAERFASLVKRANRATGAAERKDLFERALALYGGELLPGSYDDWALGERSYLGGLYASAANQLSDLRSKLGETEASIESAAEAARADPWDAALQERVLEMLWEAGRHREMKLHYRQMKRRLAEISAEPSTKSAELMAKAREALKAETPVSKVAEPEPLDTRRSTHIPLVYSRFFGRERDLEHLVRLLRDPGIRLVNLTGPGGVGKTRLAIEAARQIAQDQDRPVTFISLASLSEGSKLAGRVAEELGVEPKSGEPPIDAISREFRGTDHFLIFDNFEQIVDEGAPIVNDLLSRTRGLKMLVTSRRRLQIGPELEVSVKPIELPQVSSSLEAAAQAPAVQLFVDRAQCVRPDFALTQSNFESVARLCAALEGLPLAIELAAKRMRSMSPAQMLTMIGRRFDLLRQTQRDTDARHQTLSAAIAWSVRMLSDPCRELLPQFAIFRGSFDLSSAEVLAGAGALDSIDELVENNLMICDQGETGPARYRLYESVREFALEPFSQERTAEFRERHSRIFESLAEAAEPHSFQSDRALWYEKLRADLDNIRASLEWFESTGQRVRGLRMATSLWRFFHSTGHTSEARAWLTTFIGESRKPESYAEARAWNAAGMLSAYENDHEAALAFTKAALPLLRREADSAGIVSALVNLGDIEVQAGRHQDSIPLYDEAVGLAREANYLPGLAICFQAIAIVHLATEDYRSAEKWFAKALGVWQKAEFELGEAYALGGMASCASHLKEFDRASSLHQRAMEAHERLSDKPGTAICLYNLADLARDQGRYVESRDLFLNAIELMAALRQRIFLSYALDGLAYSEWRLGHDHVAAALLGAAARLREEAESPLPAVGQKTVDEATEALRGALGDRGFEGAWNDGYATSPSQVRVLVARLAPR